MQMDKPSRRPHGDSASPRPTRAKKPTAPSALTQPRTRREVGRGTGVAGSPGSEATSVSSATGKSEVWQARIGRELAEQLRADAGVLGLEGRTDIVKAALELLHKRAAEERMAQSVDEYYDDSTPPLPLGVTPSDAGS